MSSENKILLSNERLQQINAQLEVIDNAKSKLSDLLGETVKSKEPIREVHVDIPATLDENAILALFDQVAPRIITIFDAGGELWIINPETGDVMPAWMAKN